MSDLGRGENRPSAPIWDRPGVKMQSSLGLRRWNGPVWSLGHSWYDADGLREWIRIFAAELGEQPITLGTVWVAHTFGQLPDFSSPVEDETAYGDIVLGYWADEAQARKQAEDDFRQRDTHSWRKDVIVWHPSRDPAHRERGTYLWSMFEKAAGPMDSDDHFWYPQMRETNYWVGKLTVQRRLAADKPEDLSQGFDADKEWEGPATQAYGATGCT